MPRTPTPPKQIEFGLSVARQLAKLRRRKRVSAAAIVARAGISIDTLRALEAGRISAPGFHTVHAVAAALGASLDELAAKAELEARQHVRADDT